MAKRLQRLAAFFAVAFLMTACASSMNSLHRRVQEQDVQIGSSLRYEDCPGHPQDVEGDTLWHEAVLVDLCQNLAPVRNSFSKEDSANIIRALPGKLAWEKESSPKPVSYWFGFYVVTDRVYRGEVFLREEYRDPPEPIGPLKKNQVIPGLDSVGALKAMEERCEARLKEESRK